MTARHPDVPPVVSVDEAVRRSLALLQANLTPRGVSAASPGDAAAARRYTRIFGRDHAICALAMTGTGVPALERGARDGLDALADGQASHGQIPKFVDPDGGEADFWYLGCIDATLWWLLAVHDMRNRSPLRGVTTRWQRATRRALDWLQAQAHPHFGLLQQNEASDWADIMPRSGYVLYGNALWLGVQRRFDLPGPERTRRHAHDLFHPFRRERSDDRRVRLLQHVARRGRRDEGLYLSFVNLGGAGHEGDVFGNLLAMVYGLADEATSHRIVAALGAGRASDPWPSRAVLHPIGPDDVLWRPYMGRHRQNLPHQYHNGGLWPFIGGWWVMALARLGQHSRAQAALQALAQANAVAEWRFSEWFHGRSLQPMGMAGQSWNAAAFLLAHRHLSARPASAPERPAPSRRPARPAPAAATRGGPASATASRR